MNILVTNWMDMANPMAGGAEVHLFEIFSRIAAKGNDVTVVCSSYPGAPAEDIYNDIRIVRTGNRETFNFSAPGVIKDLMKRDKYDIVVEDINKVPLFMPLYVSTPILVIIPHLFGSAVFRETNPILASYVYLMERPLPYVYSKAVFEAISESTSGDLIRRGTRPEAVNVVYCGMDHAMYTIDASVGKYEEPTILYVGRIKKYKSVDVIIRALPGIAEEIPNVRLAVVGSGDYTDSLRKLAEKLNVVDRVEFTGFVSDEEKVDWMRRSHLIINPSPKEGWGLTNIEANACGTPAIASDADGLRDSVKDGETGLLFPYGDHEALAGKVVSLLGNDELRQQLTENAIAWAKSFTWERAADETMSLIEQMVHVS